MLPNDDISFQLWSSRNFPPLEEQFAYLKSLGYTDVQPYHGQYDDPAALRRLLDDSGLTAKSGHFELADLNARFDAAVAAARTIGMSLVIAPYLTESERPNDRDGWSALGGNLSDLANRFKDAGLTFAWHNHDFEFQPLPDGSYPIEHLLGDQVSWEPDIAWIAVAGADADAWLARYSGRIPAVHVKDLAPSGEKDDEDGWADVGSGILDWPQLWRSAVTAGSRLMVVEHDNPNDYRRFARRSIEAVRLLSQSP